MGIVTRGKVIRADLANYDGRTATYTRPDATGGTVTGLPVGDQVDVLQVYGAGTARTAGTIQSALDYIGSGIATLVFAPGTWTIAANVTIPSTLPCIIPAGCVFNVDSGKTLAFSGDVWVEYPASWTSGSGTVTAGPVHGVLPTGWA
jgi:hypothetical protein